MFSRLALLFIAVLGSGGTAVGSQQEYAFGEEFALVKVDERQLQGGGLLGVICETLIDIFGGFVNFSCDTCDLAGYFTSGNRGGVRMDCSVAPTCYSIPIPIGNLADLSLCGGADIDIQIRRGSGLFGPLNPNYMFDFCVASNITATLETLGLSEIVESFLGNNLPNEICVGGRGSFNILNPLDSLSTIPLDTCGGYVLVPDMYGMDVRYNCTCEVCGEWSITINCTEYLDLIEFECIGLDYFNISVPEIIDLIMGFI